MSEAQFTAARRTFECVTRGQLATLCERLARYPVEVERDRSSDEWLDAMMYENPEGVLALHKGYVDYLGADISAPAPEQLHFRDFVRLIAAHLYTDDPSFG